LVVTCSHFSARSADTRRFLAGGPLRGRAIYSCRPPAGGEITNQTIFLLSRFGKPPKSEGKKMFRFASFYRLAVEAPKGPGCVFFRPGPGKTGSALLPVVAFVGILFGKTANRTNTRSQAKDYCLKNRGGQPTMCGAVHPSRPPHRMRSGDGPQKNQKKKKKKGGIACETAQGPSDPTEKTGGVP